MLSDHLNPCDSLRAREWEDEEDGEDKIGGGEGDEEEANTRRSRRKKRRRNMRRRRRNRWKGGGVAEVSVVWRKEGLRKASNNDHAILLNEGSVEENMPVMVVVVVWGGEDIHKPCIFKL